MNDGAQREHVIRRSRIQIKHALIALLCAMVLAAAALAQAAPTYTAYFGTTHAHTSFSGDAQQDSNTPAIQYVEAKKDGFQFYIITDHSQYDSFTAASYAFTKQQALSYTDNNFVAMHGFEFSRNSGPNGKGHLNAINATDYMSALPAANDLPTFYNWLLAQGKLSTVVASFNHPVTDQYNDWAYLTDARRDAITMLEVINGTGKDPTNGNIIIGGLHYTPYLAALNKGWRVSPVAGLDAHSPLAIPKAKYRTGLVAESLTREGVLAAMKNRRTYATYHKKLSVIYTVNGAMMGSVLRNPAKLKFEIQASDPNVQDPNNKIIKIDIVADNDLLVATKAFDAYSVAWTTELNPQYKYYLLKVYTTEMGATPTAYIAPVWIDRTTYSSASSVKQWDHYDLLDKIACAGSPQSR